MKCSSGYHPWPIENGQNIVCFLLVKVVGEFNDSCSVHEKRWSLHYTTDTDKVRAHVAQQISWQVSEQIMNVSQLHDAMKPILGPLVYVWSASFKGAGVKKDVCICFLIIVSYSCNLPERQDMLCIKPSIAVAKPCVRCVVDMDIQDLQISDEQQIGMTRLVRSKYTQMMKRAERID